MAKKPVTVTLTLNQREADWLYDLLAETFDAGSSGDVDMELSEVIATRIDNQLRKS